MLSFLTRHPQPRLVWLALRPPLHFFWVGTPGPRLSRKLDVLEPSGRTTVLGGTGVVRPAPNGSFLHVSLLPFTTPSFPVNSSTITPRDHFPRLRSSDLTMTISPTDGTTAFPLCLRLCLSLSPLRYSLVYRLHTAPLHLRKYFSRFLRTVSRIL